MTIYQNALVLQGGGALGAYEFGVIRRLYEIPNFTLDVVGGVSIGAINAAVLVSAQGNPLRSMAAMWDEFAVMSPPLLPAQAQSWLALAGNISFYLPRSDYWRLAQWTHIYDTAPLRRTLARYVDETRLNLSPTTLVVTAVDIATGQIDIFDNRTPQDPLTVEHIVASGSLPPGFPMTTLRGKRYWDGGLFNNTPLSPVIERLNSDPAIKKRLFVVKLFPNASAIPTNMLEVSDRMMELAFASKFTDDLETAEHINEYVDLVQKIDDLLKKAAPAQAAAIHELPGYQRLQKYMTVQEIRPIENRHPELVFGPFDFSRKKIDERIEAGYWDADQMVRQMGDDSPA